MPSFKRVLILSAAAGAGHVRAAQAIEKAFEQSGAAEEVRNIDTLEYTNKVFQKLYGRVYIDLVNATPDLFGWLYDYLDKPGQFERRRLALDKLNTRPFVKMLQEYQPDIAVCTHFLPAEIISWLRGKERLNTRQVVVVTDFDIHAMWLCRRTEQYFVAMDETREHLLQLGTPADQVTVSGIPIDPVFAIHRDKEATRARLGLRPQIPTILISAGGLGVGNIEHLMTALLKLRHEAQVVAICGRSNELRTRVEEVVASSANPRVAVKVIGFTTEMDEYMSAADMVVGKTGGLTTCEALAKGLVFVIVNPIPGQEERNSDHLLEEGAAIRCNNLPTLAWKIDRLLDDPARMAAMSQAALRLGKPNAAETIVNRLREL